MDKASFNFVEFWPSFVVDLTFQHLSGKEILSATLVHPTWDQFLSEESRSAWKDIWIQPKVSNDLKYLVDSTRRYQMLKAVNISSIADDLLEIFRKPGRKWKQIVIVRTTFKTRSQVEEILKASARTVKSLELHTLSCETLTADESQNTLDFPQLKHLKLSYHFLDESPAWLNSFFGRTPLLESAHLNNASDDITMNLLLSSKHLKKLSLSGKFYNDIFFKNLSEKLGSTLEEFDFNDLQSSSSNDENLSYFNHFFQSQSRTLKIFDTDALLELDEFKTAFKMPNLHTLNIKGFHYFHHDLNQYMEQIKVMNVPPASLRVFNIHFMDQQLLELLAIHANQLQKLHADSLDISNASNPNWFPKLQEVKVVFLNPEFHKTINMKAQIERSKFEQLILDGLVTPHILVC